MTVQNSTLGEKHKENGGTMQPMSHDAFRRELSPEQWVEKAGARPDVYEAQESQWAVLRHEVEEPRQTAWDQHNTYNDVPNTSFHMFAQEPAPNHVDIVVAGVGGGGMNAINRMIDARVRGVRFIAMNTDAQVLTLSQAPTKICLGQHHTKGLGAGGDAAVGTRAATESTAEIRAALGDADLVFIAAGMGGGTGTGAAPVVASIAKKLGALTVAIVTLPFSFEGSRRRRVAERGIADLNAEIDALITVPNDRLLSVAGRERSLTDAFKIADDVLRQGVQGIAELINVPGMVNVDFADVRSVLRDAGTALMSIGQGQGRNRAQRAAEEAIAGGFLNVTIRGAKRILFNISGGEDMTLFEVNEVAERIGQAIDDSADITFGAVIDPSLQESIRVTLIAAGMEEIHTMQLPAIRLDQIQSQAKSAPAAQPLHPTTRDRLPLPGSQPVPAPPPPVTPKAPSPLPPLPPRVPSPTQGQGAGQGQQRRPNQPARQQRSLNDLRGIRSLGRRQELLRADENKDSVDVPPFLKRYD